MSNRAPDEFKVVRRAPLVIPPDYGLVPPEEAAAKVEARQSAQARSVVIADGQASLENASGAENALLAAVSQTAQPGIRSILLEDVAALTAVDESRFLTILDWQRPVFDGDQALDADEESQTLQQSGKAAKVITKRIPASDGNGAAE